MGAYDQTKDVLIQKLGKMKAEEGKPFLRARIYSYNGGDHKLSIERIRITKEGSEQFMRMGRLSREEAAFVARMAAKWGGPVEIKAEKVKDEKPSPKAAKPKRKKTGL